jgi:hypothetical protein
MEIYLLLWDTYIALYRHIKVFDIAKKYLELIAQLT